MKNGAGPSPEKLKELPSVDDLLRSPHGEAVIAAAGHARAAQIARNAVNEIRDELLSGNVEAVERAGLLVIAGERLSALWRSESATGIKRVINATGVIVHTNLGRAPLSKAATDAVREIASGYSTLEYDLLTGKRGKRGGRAEALAAQITGAEAAVIVNNCAAAAFLMLTALTAGREVIISRGELVEIGGDFRIPDVLERSGAVMREVGTTNRTKLADYERAITPGTAAILRVHPSNYRVVGFTAAPTYAELSTLAREKGILFLEDAGSGALTDLGGVLADEPVISRSIVAGVDLVTFSGDKLLGGPQSGIVVGRADLVSKLRKHPLYRVLRADKMAYAALEATLGAYARGTEREEVPVHRMLAAGRDDIKRRAVQLTAEITSYGINAEVVEGDSVIGGGSVPGSRLPTALIALSKDGVSTEDLENELRIGTIPVIGRIEDGRYLLDLRTVDPDDERALAEAISAALTRVAK
jgi:L-seryl-tRNA(Ser) seleniumtransferase